MLSKSQARAFFLAGTGVCAVAFIGLTVDTFSRIPAQAHEDQITPAVARGKDLWDHNNCMGCHTLFGEGAYYAPELTKVIERRGETFVKAMLKDPQAMFPGARKMQNYHFTDAQIDDLVVFLRWCGGVDLNGFPAKPDLMPVAVATSTAAAAGEAPVASSSNRPQVFNQLCVACHMLDGQGGQVGPALDGVGARKTLAELRTWLHDPAAVKPGTQMPKLPLTDEQIDELAAFLSQRKGATP